MAADYTVLYQYPTTEFLGGTQTQPATAVGYQTTAHQIVFESRIPDKSYTSTEVDNTGKVNGQALENLFSIDGVTDVEWTQVSKPSGYLADEIIVYFETPSGNSSGSITTPFTGISNDVVKPLVAAAIAKLVESEDL